MENNLIAYKSRNYMKVLLPIVGIGIVLTVVTFALTIVILVKVNKRFDEKQGDSIPATTSSTSSTPPSTNAFSTTINPTTTLTNQLVTTSTNQPVTTSTNQASTTSQPSPSSILASSIRIEDVMNHLTELQRIATAENGTRAINTLGFNRTLDYITDTLANYTNYNVTKSFFSCKTIFARSESNLYLIDQ
jgi:hypothetical protein